MQHTAMKEFHQSRRDCEFGRSFHRNASTIRRLLLLALALLLTFEHAAGLIRQYGVEELFYPLDTVVDAFETVLEPSEAHFNQVAGALALHGNVRDAQRSLDASLRLDPRNGEALYLLGSILCRSQRRGSARDAFRKAHTARTAGNPFESNQVNIDACSVLPLLMPADAIMLDNIFPVFAHYMHEERIYLVHTPSSKPRRNSGGDLLERGIGLGNMEIVVKQSSGNAAHRESLVLEKLASVREGEFAAHFPVIYQDDDLDWVSEHVGRGLWGAYMVEHVRRVSANTLVSDLVGRHDYGGLGIFVNDTLRILQALSEAGIVHNNLNAEQLLIGTHGRAVLVDAEIAAGKDTHVHIRVHTYIHTYIRSVLMYVCLHVHIYACMHTCAYIHTYIHTENTCHQCMHDTCTYSYSYIFVCMYCIQKHLTYTFVCQIWLRVSMKTATWQAWRNIQEPWRMFLRTRGCILPMVCSRRTDAQRYASRSRNGE
jgi:hypothetical protein